MQTQHVLKSFCTTSRVLLVFVASLVLVACDQSTQDNPVASAGDDSALVLDVPDSLLSVRAIDPNALSATVTVNGEDVEAVRSDGASTIMLDVPQGVSLEIRVDWFERFNNMALPLATWSDTLASEQANGNIRIDRAAYVTDTFDTDGDGVSNLQERIAGTNPLESVNSEAETETSADNPTVETPLANDAPAAEVDVSIAPVDTSAGAPVIDGAFDDIWQQATFSNVRGANLFINRLVGVDPAKTTEAALQDGVQDYIWFAMHDFQNLYLFIQLDGNGVTTPFRDSGGLFFNDDAVNLFIDPNLSRDSTLQVDDLYVAIPLLPTTGEERPTVFTLDSAPVIPPSFEYGVCDGVNTCLGVRSGWEVKIALADLGIVPGVPFGIEIQIDEDIDGGDRDARFSWFNPPLSEQDDSFRYESPALNGVAVLAGR